MDIPVFYLALLLASTLGIVMIFRLRRRATKGTNTQTPETSTELGSVQDEYPLSRASAYATGGEYSEPVLRNASPARGRPRPIEKVFSIPPRAPAANVSGIAPATAAPAAHSPSPLELDFDDLDLDGSTVRSCQQLLVEVHTAIQQWEQLNSDGDARKGIDFLLRFTHQIPESPPTPWILLMNAYHAADKRMIYETLAPRFHKRFGRPFPAWSSAPVGIDQTGLRDEPLLRARLERHWGQPDCISTLYNVLMDHQAPAPRFFNVVLQRELLELAFNCPAPLAAAAPSFAPPFPARTNSVERQAPQPAPTVVAAKQDISRLPALANV